jgi:hypothetical protein
MMSVDSHELVKHYLHGRNLEQLGRLEEAVEEYEVVVAEEFDSTGPYDRLIAVYAHQARHADVVRVADAALAHVRTHRDKAAWYERMRAEALRAAAGIPKPAPK